MNIAIGAAIMLGFVWWWHYRATMDAQTTEAIADEFLYMQGTLTAPDYARNFVAATISVATVFIAMSDFARQYGGDTLWLLFAFLLGIPVFMFHVERVGHLFKPSRTLPEVIGTAFNSRILRKTAAACSIMYLAGSIGVELYVFHLLARAALPKLDLLVSAFVVIFVAFVFIKYSLAGGYRGMKANDPSQLAAILAASLVMSVLLILMLLLPPQSGGIAVSVDKLAPYPVPPFSTSRLLVVGSCVALMLPWLTSTPDTWHRCVATGMNRDRILLGFVGKRFLNIFMLAFVWLIPIIIGVAWSASSDEAPVFGRFLGKTWPLCETLPSPLPGLIIGIVGAGLVGASMSSVDVLLMSLAFLVCNEAIPRYQTFSEARKLITARFTVLLGGILTVTVPVAAIILDLNLYLVMSTIGSSIIILFPAMLTVALFGDACQQSVHARRFVTGALKELGSHLHYEI